MTPQEKVAKVARGQIGVCESPSGSNRTKYGKKFGLNGKPWCAIFVWWCFFKAGLSNIIGKNSSAAYIQEATVAKGGRWIMRKNKSETIRKEYLSNAQVGDVVSFDFGAMDAVRDHVGIVVGKSGNYLITVEGNTSKKGSQSNGGMVCEQRRLYTSVCSAVRPKWSNKIYPLVVDGEMGFETSCRLQRWLKVTEDGVVGPNTVTALQRKVGAKVDGTWGSETTSALQRYLNKHGAGLVTNGKKDKATIKALQKFLNKAVTK